MSIILNPKHTQLRPKDMPLYYEGDGAMHMLSHESASSYAQIIAVIDSCTASSLELKHLRKHLGCMTLTAFTESSMFVHGNLWLITPELIVYVPVIHNTYMIQLWRWQYIAHNIIIESVQKLPKDCIWAYEVRPNAYLKSINSRLVAFGDPELLQLPYCMYYACNVLYVTAYNTALYMPREMLCMHDSVRVMPETYVFVDQLNRVSFMHRGSVLFRGVPSAYVLH